MIQVIYKNLRSNKLDLDTEFKKGCWVNLSKPTEEEIIQIIDEYDLDDGLIHDALDLYEVPRYERIDDTRYIFTRYPSDISSTTSPITIIFGTYFIITITLDSAECIESLLKQNIITTQKTKLLIQILNSIASSYERKIIQINKKITTFSAKIERIENEEIKQLVEFEKTLNEFSASLVPTNQMFHRILTGKSITVYEEDAELIEDISLNINQLIDNSQSLLKYIVNIREAYSTILTNNLNKTMKFLTAVTVILTIPTIITSFFGMNVRLPFEGHELAYIIIIFLTLGVSAGTLFLLMKNRMI